jgi:hypothetical protein
MLYQDILKSLEQSYQNRTITQLFAETLVVVLYQMRFSGCNQERVGGAMNDGKIVPD